MRIFKSRLRPFSEIRHVAIAIAAIRPGQYHVGLLHKEEFSGQVKLAHLAWHNQLKNSEPKDCYLWIDPPLPTRRARHVAARCRQILRTNRRGIPYAFSPPNDCFDLESARFLFGPSRFGLTCATFVLAVFHSAGFPLAEYESWPKHRPGDLDWQQSVIAQLENDGASAEHIAFIRTEIGAVRYRPEDVAGCATSDHVPCLFSVGNIQAQEVLKHLQMHGKFLRDSY